MVGSIVSLAILAAGVFWYLRWRKQPGGNRVSEYNEHDKGQPMSPFLSSAGATLAYYVSPLDLPAPSVWVANLRGTSYR